MGDGVAERTKVSVPTCTIAGLNSTKGSIFLLAVMVSGGTGRHPPPGHGRYLRAPISLSIHSTYPKTNIIFLQKIIVKFLTKIIN